MKRASAPSNDDQPSPHVEVMLPARAVLYAGLTKFTELANLNWPDKSGGLVQFDMKNHQQLQIMLGLVYMAMRKADQ